LRRRCDLQMRDIPFFLQDFTDRYEGQHHDIQLPHALGVAVAFQRKKPAAIGTKAPFPGFVEPALAISIEKVPTGDRWLHEIKFDGYRVQDHLVNDQGFLTARQRLD
jgi:ATP-dependent DNA ligase